MKATIKECNRIKQEIVDDSTATPYSLKPTSSPVKAIIWDLDDVLVNTSMNVRQCRIYACQSMLENVISLSRTNQTIRSVLKERGILENPNALQDMVYPLLMDIVKRRGSNAIDHYNVLWEDLGIGKELFADTIIHHNAIVQTGVKAYRTMKRKLWKRDAHIIGIIRDVSQRYGIKQGIVTSALSDAKQLEKMRLTGLDTVFDPRYVSIVCPKYDKTMGIYTEPPTKEDAFHAMSERFDVPKEEIYSVGDRLSDVESSNNTGIKSIYFLNRTGKYHRNERIKCRPQIPHFIIDHCEQIYTVIEMQQACKK